MMGFKFFVQQNFELAHYRFLIKFAFPNIKFMAFGEVAHFLKD